MGLDGHIHRVFITDRVLFGLCMHGVSCLQDDQFAPVTSSLKSISLMAFNS